MKLRRNPCGGLMAPKPGGALPRWAWRSKKGAALALEQWTAAAFDWGIIVGPSVPWTAAWQYGFVAEGLKS